jgi:hypothetical protein
MELELQSLLGSMCTTVLTGWDPATLPPPPPTIPPHLGSYHIRGRYWSVKTEDISLWPPGLYCLRIQKQRKWLSYNGAVETRVPKNNPPGINETRFLHPMIETWERKLYFNISLIFENIKTCQLPLGRFFYSQKSELKKTMNLNYSGKTF